MSDWRLSGQEKYLAGKTLYKIDFPAFWKLSYESRNLFYQKIADYAKKQVEETGRWAELLEGENVQRFWHEHCEFCWEKASTDKECTFYCTEDMYRWICEDCFRDFSEQFHWQVKPVEELFKQSI